MLFAGTSGFAYTSWKPRFYPEKLPATRFLEYYSQRLNSVEINYTFRRNPSLPTLEKWVQATPPGFLFCLKGHMRITHILRLKDAGEAVERFLQAADPLRVVRRLGPVLFQLPPQLKCDTSLLADFLAVLPTDVRFAFEFRHASWLVDEVYDLLRTRNAALCVAETEDFQVPQVITADFGYFRLRKPEYSEPERAAIRNRCADLLAGVKDVFVFFKHEDTPEGALYAQELLNGVKS